MSFSDINMIPNWFSVMAHKKMYVIGHGCNNQTGDCILPQADSKQGPLQVYARADGRKPQLSRPHKQCYGSLVKSS